MNSNLKVLLIVGFFLISSNMFSQSILAMGVDTVGEISVDGKVTDLMNQKRGEISSNGDVTGIDGATIGSILNNKFNDANGNLLGEIKVVGNETQVVMADGNVFGTIESSNKIQTSDGSILLSSTGAVTVLQLVAYFFYF